MTYCLAATGIVKCYNSSIYCVSEIKDSKDTLLLMHVLLWCQFRFYP